MVKTIDNIKPTDEVKAIVKIRHRCLECGQKDYEWGNIGDVFHTRNRCKQCGATDRIESHKEFIDPHLNGAQMAFDDPPNTVIFRCGRCGFDYRSSYDVFGDCNPPKRCSGCGKAGHMLKVSKEPSYSEDELKVKDDVEKASNKETVKPYKGKATEWKHYAFSYDSKDGYDAKFKEVAEEEKPKEEVILKHWCNYCGNNYYTTSREDRVEHMRVQEKYRKCSKCSKAATIETIIVKDKKRRSKTSRDSTWTDTGWERVDPSGPQPNLVGHEAAYELGYPELGSGVPTPVEKKKKAKKTKRRCSVEHIAAVEKIKEQVGIM